MVISIPGCNLPGQTHGMPRMLHFDSRVRNFESQVANTNRCFFHSPPAVPAFSCGAVLLWDCILNPHAPLFPPCLHLCLDTFPLHISKPLLVTSFLRQWWARWMESVNTRITFSSYPDQNINKYKYTMNFLAICVWVFFHIHSSYLYLNLYFLYCEWSYLIPTADSKGQIFQGCSAW